MNNLKVFKADEHDLGIPNSILSAIHYPYDHTNVAETWLKNAGHRRIDKLKNSKARELEILV
jgi:hypothetical protein